jgi:hypothetical protein
MYYSLSFLVAVMVGWQTRHCKTADDRGGKLKLRRKALDAMRENSYSFVK